MRPILFPYLQIHDAFHHQPFRLIIIPTLEDWGLTVIRGKGGKLQDADYVTNYLIYFNNDILRVTVAKALYN